MADYPNVIESISFQAAHTVDGVEVVYGFAVSPYAGGIKTCRFIGVFEQFVNSVWDPGGPARVYWETPGSPDPAGEHYPDPFATGFGGTESYRSSGLRYR